MKKRILFCRTAPNHVCELALSWLRRNHENELYDYFGSIPYTQYKFSEEFLVSYKGYLSSRKISSAMLDQLKEKEYELIVFPYTVNGQKPYYNLLKFALSIRAKKVLLINELGEIKYGSISKILLEDIKVIFSLTILSPLFFLIIFYWFVRDIIRQLFHKVFNHALEIHVIRGTTNLIIPPSEIIRDTRDEHIRIGCIARLDPVKGHIYLLEAVAELIRKYNHRVELYLIGHGPEYEKLRLRSIELKIDHLVHFEGNQYDIRPYLRECQFFVLPSLSEAMPISVIEVFAAQRPVIATKVGGVPQIVKDKVNGLLVEPGTSEQLAEAMHTLISDQDFGVRLAANGYDDYINLFSPEIMADKYMNVFRQVSGTSPKDVWIVSSFDLSMIGGLPKYVDLLSTTLVNRGINVRIIQPPLINYNIRIFIMSKLLKGISFVFFTPKAIVECYFRKMIVLLKFLQFIHQKGKPDIVNVHDVISYGAISRLCKILNIPLLLTKHGELAKEISIQYYKPTSSFLYQHFAGLERAAYADSSCLVVVDEASKRRLERNEIA